MDIATIVGLLAAFGLIFMAISENAPAFVDTASLLIVVAGSIAVVMARCSLGEFLGAMGVMGKAFSRKIDDPVELITQIVELANIARKDGMIALEDGAKRWITGPLMRRSVHLLRSRSEGLLSAVGTVLADDPEFTCRLAGLHGDSPHRFILDASLRTPPSARLFETAGDVGLTFFCREDCDPQKAVALRAAGAEIMSVDVGDDGKLSLFSVMRKIAEAGIGSLMVEAGGKLAASLLRDGLVDRILWTSSQHLIGSDGIPAISGLATGDIGEIPAFSVIAEGGFDRDRFILLERTPEMD